MPLVCSRCSYCSIMLVFMMRIENHLYIHREIYSSESTNVKTIAKPLCVLLHLEIQSILLTSTSLVTLVIYGVDIREDDHTTTIKK